MICGLIQAEEKLSKFSSCDVFSWVKEMIGGTRGYSGGCRSTCMVGALCFVSGFWGPLILGIYKLWHNLYVIN